MRNISLRIGLLLATLSCSADGFAHEMLTTPRWCEGGVVRMTGAFSFSTLELADHAACLRSGACVDPPPPSSSTARGGGNCSTQSCGEFDDDYGVGARRADRHCAAYAYQPAAARIPDEGEVLPVVTSPSQFNLATHHDTYRFSQGLSGMCALCTAPHLDDGHQTD
jgi:hypothetical protein